MDLVADKKQSGPGKHTRRANPAGDGRRTALYLVSSATRDPFFFLLGWLDPDQRAWGSLACRWALCSAFFALIAWKSPRFVRLFAFALPFVMIAASAVAFARETGLSPLYRDDHPSFLFRIWIFSESFPQLIYYNPLWNGGKIATYVVASGATGPGLLFLPFLWIWPIEQIYSSDRGQDPQEQNQQAG